MHPVYIGTVILVIGLIIALQVFLKREKRYKIKYKLAMERKVWKEAVELAQKLCSIKPNNVEYHVMLAEAYEKEKLFSVARQIFEKLLQRKLFTRNWSEGKIRGKISYYLLEEGNVINAFKEAYIASIKDPSFYLTHLVLGRLYGSQKKYDKAEKHLKKALELAPDRSETYYWLGLFYLDTNKLDSAVETLLKGYNKNPGDVSLMYWLALAARQQGRLPELTKTLFEKLNLAAVKDLPDKVTELNILAQGIPKFEIDKQEETLKEQFGTESKAKDERVKNLEEFVQLSTEKFHATALNIINKLGLWIIKEVRGQLIDPSIEVDFVCKLKKEKDKPDAEKYYVEIYKSETEVGTIPFADFIAKAREAKCKNAIFITSSSFNPGNVERVKKEKDLKISLIDGRKLVRYL